MRAMRPMRVVAEAKPVAEPEGLKTGLQALTGVLGLAALTVAFNYKSIRGFKDEQDFAVTMRSEGLRPRPHRCNDRVEDFCQVWAGAEGSILTQGPSSITKLFKCFASKPGQEPSDPYLVLTPNDRHYISPGERAQQQQQQQ